MTENEALLILWNMRSDYIKAQNCGLSSGKEFYNEIRALDFVIYMLIDLDCMKGVNV